MDLGVSGPQTAAGSLVPCIQSSARSCYNSFLHNNNVGEREILTRDKATFVLGREREVK